MGVGDRSFAFPRSRRLQRSSDFARVRAQGKRLAHGCLILNWMPAAGPDSQLGVVTGKKLGNAVARNRARRQLREIFRRRRMELSQPLILIFVARPSMAGQDFDAVQRDFLGALRRAGLWAGIQEKR
jgi:ribonuclease P protein component